MEQNSAIYNLICVFGVLVNYEWLEIQLHIHLHIYTTEINHTGYFLNNTSKYLRTYCKS